MQSFLNVGFADGSASQMHSLRQLGVKDILVRVSLTADAARYAAAWAVGHVAGIAAVGMRMLKRNSSQKRLEKLRKPRRKQLMRAS